jgi:hypothetical protein
MRRPAAADDGYRRAPPNWNGRGQTGKVRISQADFTIAGARLIDLANFDERLQGYHGACAVKNRIFFVPHYSDAEGFHSRIVVTDVRDLNVEDLKMQDAHRLNSPVGA